MNIILNFAGQNSNDIGVFIKSHRQMLPPLRPRLLEVASRDGSYDFEGNTYGDREIAVDGFVASNSFEDLRAKARQIAVWLSKKGKLFFSDEPNLYYIGRIYNAVSLQQEIISTGKFSVNFIVQPIAFGKIVENSKQSIATSEISTPIAYGGTYKTCCRIFIKNTGATPLNALQLFHEMRSES